MKINTQKNNLPLILLNSNFVPGPWPKYEVPSSYYQTILEYGGLPLMAPSKGNEEDLIKLAELADAFCFTGGHDYPAHLFGMQDDKHTHLMHENRVSADMTLAKIALDSNKPILAICAGHQLLQIAQGGKLIPHLHTHLKHRDDVYHSVKLEPESQLFKLFGKKEINVNSNHHQANDPHTIPSQFRITALAKDGTVEAMEAIDKQWILSLQWHPERIKFPEHREKIFKSFISESKNKLI